MRSIVVANSACAVGSLAACRSAAALAAAYAAALPAARTRSTGSSATARASTWALTSERLIPSCAAGERRSSARARRVAWHRLKRGNAERPRARGRSRRRRCIQWWGAGGAGRRRPRWSIRLRQMFVWRGARRARTRLRRPGPLAMNMPAQPARARLRRCSTFRRGARVLSLRERDGVQSPVW